MNESHFESIFAIFDEKSPFCLFWTLLETFWALFWFDQKQWLPDSLNNHLNWITIVYFELNNSSNSIFGKQYWIENWIESFRQNSNIQLNQIGYKHPYSYTTSGIWQPTQLNHHGEGLSFSPIHGGAVLNYRPVCRVSCDPNDLFNGWPIDGGG